MTLPIKRGDPHRFPCGHRREPSNMSKEKFPGCIACKRLRYLETMERFKCGHPVTPENVRYHGVKNKYRRCRTCDNERQQQMNQRVRGMAKRRVEREKRVPPVTEPVLVCRLERAKREDRQSPAIEAAKAEYLAMLARAEVDRKGGRPRKHQPTFAQRCEPGDELIVALGHLCGTRGGMTAAAKQRGLTLSVAMPPNLANSRMHWRVKHNTKVEYWKTLDALSLTTKAAPPPQPPLGRCRIASVMYLGAKMDADNAMARHKWVLDWLQSRGYIANDKHLEWVGLPEQVVKRNGRYRIELTLTEEPHPAP
jgi:hypothetical protein